MFTKCAYDSVIGKGLRISLDILKPRVAALQHVGCEDKLPVYKEAYKSLGVKFKMGAWIVPRKFNQDFEPLPPKAH